MKNSLISTFIAATCLTASGVTMAAANEAVENTTVTTKVTGVSNVTILLNDTPETVTTDDVNVPGTLLTTLSIDASGFDISSANGGNIAVEVSPEYFDSNSGAWLFKNNDKPSSTPLKARPKPGNGWHHEPENRISYRLSSGGNTISADLPIETNVGNTNVSAGDYSMPLTVSHNTW